MRLSFVTVLFLALAFAGCTSATQAVRPSVVLIIDHLDAYEQALDARVAAEEKYYAAHTATLDKAAGQATLVARDVRQRELIFAYADAARADGVPLRLSRLMQFLATADDEFSAALVEYMTLSAENRTAAASSFATLEMKRETLAQVRGALQELLQGADLEARAKFWSDYFGRVNKELGKAKKDQEDQSKVQTPQAPASPGPR